MRQHGDGVSAAPGERQTLGFVRQSGDFCVKHNLTAYSLSKKSIALLRRAGGRASEITYSHERQHVLLFFVCSLLLFLGKIGH